MTAAHTPGPWKACRSHEDFDGPMFDIDPEDQAEYDARPFVGILAATGTVATAHDLFEFKPEDARLIAAAPGLLEALYDALPYVEDVLSNKEQLACFKAGVVQKHAAAIRAAIAKATGSEA